jgi:putative transcriptional regulator
MMTLKEYRESKGVKLKAVADYLGVSRQTYSRYEEEQEQMSLAQAKTVCDFLGCNIQDVFLSNDVK